MAPTIESWPRLYYKKEEESLPVLELGSLRLLTSFIKSSPVLELGSLTLMTSIIKS